MWITLWIKCLLTSQGVPLLGSRKGDNVMPHPYTARARRLNTRDRANALRPEWMVTRSGAEGRQRSSGSAAQTGSGRSARGTQGTARRASERPYRPLLARGPCQGVRARASLPLEEQTSATEERCRIRPARERAAPRDLIHAR